MAAILRAIVLSLAIVFVVAAPLTYASKAQSDVSPPDIVALTINPKQIDTSHSPQTITVTAHITDDLSGLQYLTIWFGPLLYGNDQDKAVNIQASDLASGTLTNGVFVTTLTLPRYSADGRWIAKYMGIQDQVGNTAWCMTNGEMECPADWGTYYFANGNDVSFQYIPFLSAIHTPN